MVAFSLQKLKADNTDRWNRASLNADRVKEFEKVAKALMSGYDKYRDVSMRVSQMPNCHEVPWYVIAVIHEREASRRWDRNIAQGDPWCVVSTHVPQGRGPFKSWEDAACDALVNCAPFAAKNIDWSIGGTLTLLERYNGLGYASMKPPLPSPYIWSGTNQYTKGKYVKDRDFRPEVVDKQVGCAGLLIAMSQITTINLPPRTGAANPTTASDPAAANPATAGSPGLMPTLRLGDTGPNVATMQQRLNACGAHLHADGRFGPATERALTLFQGSRGLLSDGICGRATWTALMKGSDAFA